MALRLIGSQLLCHVKDEFRLQERPDTLVIGRFSGKHAVVEIRSGTSVYFNKIDPAAYFVGKGRLGKFPVAYQSIVQLASPLSQAKEICMSAYHKFLIPSSPVSRTTCIPLVVLPLWSHNKPSLAVSSNIASHFCNYNTKTPHQHRGGGPTVAGR